MKKLSLFAILILSALVILVTMPELKAQTPTVQHGKHFVDLNGDGYNDNAPDADGDGIPNGQDPDYQKNPNAKGWQHRKFVDLNGDGFNDNAPDADGDGIPNGKDPDYKRPLDGSGQKLGSPERKGNMELRRTSRRFQNKEQAGNNLTNPCGNTERKQGRNNPGTQPGKRP